MLFLQIYKAWTFSDIRASGNNCGTSTAATIHIRTLNTSTDPTINSSCQLNLNQLTFTAGTYQINASTPICAAGGTSAYFFNVTNGIYEITGSNVFSDSVSTIQCVSCPLSGVIVVTGTKVYELRHYINLGLATTGLGRACTTGLSEIYSTVTVVKLA